MYYSTYMYIIGSIVAFITLVGTLSASPDFITLSPSGEFLLLRPVEHAVVFLANIIFLYFSMIVESYEEGDTGFPV